MIAPGPTRAEPRLRAGLVILMDMRVVAGTARGQKLSAPKDSGVRPMTDRAKESLFSHLRERPRGARVLDLFAGSGALSIEALSRGAEFAVLVDSSSAALETARSNLQRCGFAGKAELVKSDVRRFLERGKKEACFDLVFVDPPYAMDDKAVEGILELVAPRLCSGAVVCLHREKARLERHRREMRKSRRPATGDSGPLLPWPKPYRVVFERSYGGAVVGVAEIAERG